MKEACLKFSIIFYGSMDIFIVNLVTLALLNLYCSKVSLINPQRHFNFLMAKHSYKVIDSHGLGNVLWVGDYDKILIVQESNHFKVNILYPI